MILEDNLSLNLYVMSIICCVVIILEDQGLARRGFLVDLSWKSLREFLVNFQTKDYKVFTQFHILSL